MKTRVETVAIIGLGLIGGSLAKALKDNGFCREVIGYGHREPSLRRGLELGVIDSFTLDLDAALSAADIVVICTPTLVAAEILVDILARTEALEQPPVITDGASVKGNLERAARSACKEFPPYLVLGHPIAGSERSGVEAARSDLYVNHRVILTPVAENSSEALALVSDMWAAAGATVVQMTVARHDAVLAATSHLPHVLAYALVDALAESDESDEIFRCAAGGFRDFTRIASSDPVMWRDIAIANKAALLQAIDQFNEHLQQLRRAVVEEDAAGMHETFTRAKQARDEFAAILAEREQAKTS
ncbi:prephenate dehydrogenase/arogenate dehydrogenase family protein [Pseudohalioglobus sediminis]|uniref:prephenate dehydrogenase n=1 Tax=Pseudohalioglobus sediminis TaxID=2606449 RepID=A0A5B0X1C3_9GAMM|nr:prephenate dehydrogenase/arogenate dehydrogenase family protein [Pseudohalioglobus sediminis]KAA1192438.1 prephenate dehydrogenase/arogenate dehydrogenase family protein [Pseudohalioglobus sediminis]